MSCAIAMTTLTHSRIAPGLLFASPASETRNRSARSITQDLSLSSFSSHVSAPGGRIYVTRMSRCKSWLASVPTVALAPYDSTT